MEFRVLGPVEVWDGEPVPIGGTKPRTLLAALLIEPGQVVPVHRLVEIIWGDAPPETAGGLIQTYVSMLRRSLADRGRAEVIITRPPGYLIKTSAGEVDRSVFETLAGQAREAVARGQHEHAADRFRAALALWHGPALGGIGGPVLAGEAARLDEQRLAVLEDRVAADLALGRYEALVSELTALVSAHPTRELLRRHLMVALYAVDRQADALTVYRDGRAMLIDELGIEPGPALRAAHDAILQHDRDLLRLLPPPAMVEVSAPVAPAQLPSVPADFTGRGAQIGELVRRLTPRAARAGMPICLVCGKGGAGKSTLVIRAAHELAAEYPDGQLYAELHGMSDTPGAPETVLGRFLAALGVAPADLPSTMDERADRFRSMVAGRRILVVLDDAASEQQIRPLLPGSPSCGVLVTARGRLPGLAGAELIELDVLDPDEAGELLARIAGRDRVDAEPEAARQLVDACGRLPLAVRIAGARLATRRHWSLARLGDRLADERRRLDELAAGDQEVRATISLSYRALAGPEQTALRRLGLLGLSEFPAWVVAALLDTDEAEAEDIVERLVDAQCVEFARTDPAGQARYQVHDLIRLYAVERAADEPDGQAGAAVHRVIAGWLELVDTIAAAQPTGGISLRPQRETAGWRPKEAVAAAVANPRAWFVTEQHALVASVERAAAMDIADDAADLASALSGSLFVTGNLFDAWTRTHEAALAAVRRAGKREAEAALLAEFGQLRYEQDRYAEARSYLMQALAVFRECGAAHGEAATLATLGIACREQGYLPEALHFLTQARDGFTELGDAAAVASTDRLAGSVHLELGDLPEANRCLAGALVAFRQQGSRRGEALTLRTISLAHRAVGDYPRALETARHAQVTFHELGDELLEAYALRAIGKAQLRLGDTAEALPLLQEALQTCRSHHDRWGEALTLRTLGELHLAERRWAEAGVALDAALQIWRAIDLPVARARTLRDLSRLHQALGDQPAADAQRAEALETFRLYGVREQAELLQQS